MKFISPCSLVFVAVIIVILAGCPRDGEGIETLMWAIDGDFIADDIQEEALGDNEYEEWDHEDDEEGDQINFLDYEKLEYDYDEDNKNAS